MGVGADLNAITYIVPGTPIAKGRARFGNGHAYTPQRTKNAESKTQQAAIEAMNKARLRCHAGPVAVMIDAYMPIPAKWPKQKRVRAMSGELRPASRPDIDNIAKQFLDGMNKIVYIDDGQIVELSVRQWFAAAPETRVTVKFL